jgi:hypothetical protein
LNHPEHIQQLFANLIVTTHHPRYASSYASATELSPMSQNNPALLQRIRAPICSFRGIADQMTQTLLNVFT